MNEWHVLAFHSGVLGQDKVVSVSASACRVQCSRLSEFRSGWAARKQHLPPAVSRVDAFNSTPKNLHEILWGSLPTDSMSVQNCRAPSGYFRSRVFLRMLSVPHLDPTGYLEFRYQDNSFDPTTKAMHA